MIPTTGLDERPRDPELGGPVPFVCEDDEGRASVRILVKKRVTRCALSRICAVCGDTLGQPVALLGTREELGRMEFHLPPLHIACGEAVAAGVAGAPFGVLGQDDAVPAWVLVTTGGFEHERAQAHDPDRRPRFRPNAVVDSREL